MKYIKIEKVEESTGVCLVTLHRPEAKNALNRQMVAELTQFIQSLEGEKETRVVILQGTEQNFASGADVKEMANATIEEVDNISRQVHELHALMNQSEMIFIASLEGYCLGGGFELALASDIRISSESTVFGLPEVKLGILPGGGGTQKVLSLAGNSFAIKYLLTGDFFDAKKALAHGLITEVVENPLQTSIDMAQKIAINSPASIGAIKKLLTGVEYALLSNRLEEERAAFKQLFIEGDAREGLRAFIEKRQPIY